MIVAVAFDDAALGPAAAPDVAGVLDAVVAVEAALARIGHATVRLPVARGGAWRDSLVMARAAVVFNLCEGIAGDAAAEAVFAAALEELGIPFTGASAAGLALARRKDRVNALLAGLVPVPAWTLAPGLVPGDWPHYPAIVKPAGQDAGIGITQGAVVHSPAELERALRAARAHEPLLVQRYLGGRELVVGFVAGEALPVAEIEFAAMPAGLPHVVGYAAKWHAGSPEDLGTRARCPAHIDAATASAACDVARIALDAICPRGYARVDLRADDAGELHVLDVNANPDLAPDAGLARMAAAAGWSHDALVRRILDEALA
jgi:D-alanine-D-alanine ligase